MKKIFLLSTALASALFASYANADSSEPEQCPSIREIRLVNFTSVLKDGSLWYAMQRNQLYGTQQKWDFIFGHFPAGDEAAILKAAAEIISTSKFMVMGPIKDDGSSKKPPFWMCMYGTQYNGKDYKGFIATPTGSLDEPLAYDYSKLKDIHEKIRTILIKKLD